MISASVMLRVPGRTLDPRVRRRKQRRVAHKVHDAMCDMHLGGYNLLAVCNPDGSMIASVAAR